MAKAQKERCVSGVYVDVLGHVRFQRRFSILDAEYLSRIEQQLQANYGLITGCGTRPWWIVSPRDSKLQQETLQG